MDNQKKYDKILNNKSYVLTEQDFYPPSDDRVWTSEIEDIDDGDSFADYCKEFFEMLDEEDYYEEAQL